RGDEARSSTRRRGCRARCAPEAARCDAPALHLPAFPAVKPACTPRRRGRPRPRRKQPGGRAGRPAPEPEGTSGPPRVKTCFSHPLARGAGGRVGAVTVPEHISVVYVEDDERLARLTQRYLESHGLVVTIARDGREGLAQTLRTWPDVVLLDLMLPHLDG